MNESILEVRGVSAGYKNRPVLTGVDLTLGRGKVYSVIGPNGCGKTTLLRVIGRSLKPTAGEVLLDGENVFRTNTKKIARKMAILTQSHAEKQDVTVRELAFYGRYAHGSLFRGNTAEDRAAVDWALARTNLTALADRKLHALSGGERQRAWIAMSLAQKPSLLLLDEPTTYLDVAHQLEIMELIARLGAEEGITVLSVLHDLTHAARYSDELIVLSGGAVVRRGDPWEVLGSGVLRDVFRVEAEITRDGETGRPIVYAKRATGYEL